MKGGISSSLGNGQRPAQNLEQNLNQLLYSESALSAIYKDDKTSGILLGRFTKVDKKVILIAVINEQGWRIEEYENADVENDKVVTLGEKKRIFPIQDVIDNNSVNQQVETLCQLQSESSSEIGNKVNSLQQKLDCFSGGTVTEVIENNFFHITRLENQNLCITGLDGTEYSGAKMLLSADNKIIAGNVSLKFQEGFLDAVSSALDRQMKSPPPPPSFPPPPHLSRPINISEISLQTEEQDFVSDLEILSLNKGAVYKPKSGHIISYNVEKKDSGEGFSLEISNLEESYESKTSVMSVSNDGVINTKSDSSLDKLCHSIKKHVKQDADKKRQDFVKDVKDDKYIALSALSEAVGEERITQNKLMRAVNKFGDAKITQESSNEDILSFWFGNKMTTPDRIAFFKNAGLDLETMLQLARIKDESAIYEGDDEIILGAVKKVLQNIELKDAKKHITATEKHAKEFYKAGQEGEEKTGFQKAVAEIKGNTDIQRHRATLESNPTDIPSANGIIIDSVLILKNNIQIKASGSAVVNRSGGASI